MQSRVWGKKKKKMFLPFLALISRSGFRPIIFSGLFHPAAVSSTRKTSTLISDKHVKKELKWCDLIKLFKTSGNLQSLGATDPYVYLLYSFLSPAPGACPTVIEEGGFGPIVPSSKAVVGRVTLLLLLPSPVTVFVFIHPEACI